MKNVVKIAGIFLIFLSLLAGIAYYFVYWPNTNVKDEGIIYIKREATFQDVLSELQQKAYIENPYTFRQVARLKKYSFSVKPGRYRISDRMNNNELVNMLRAGRQAAVNFTFNNVRTLEQFAGIASRQLGIDSLSFLRLVEDPEYCIRQGFTTDNILGMFIPNTYQIYWNIPVEKLVERMAQEYKRFWNSSRVEKAEKAGLSPMDVIILASIVEEETTEPEEYPIIAGVYINRVKKDIPLAACPTLKYALGDFSLKRILKKHMEVESPYNTYKYKGLPPGPVRMPSIQVIDAVLNYRKHDYLYFCAKSDFSGRHSFSKTLRQHNNYAREYHRALNQRGIY